MDESEGSIIIDFNHITFDDEGTGGDPISFSTVEIPSNKRLQFITFLREVANDLESNNQFINQGTSD